jgi:hypothetical protein
MTNVFSNQPETNVFGTATTSQPEVFNQSATKVFSEPSNVNEVFATSTSKPALPDKIDALFWLGGMGMSDSIRGVAQEVNKLTGRPDTRNQEQQEMIEALLDEYGAAGMAAYYGGMFADPVGWLLPMSRLKHIKTFKDFATKFLPLSAAGGAAAGGMSYIPEGTQSLLGEGEMSRLEMAGLGAVGQTALAPAFAGAGKLYQKVFDPRKQVEGELWNLPEIKGGMGVGEGAWKIISHPTGSGAAVGALAGYNFSPNASEEDKRENMLRGALIGGASFTIPKALDKMVSVRSGQKSTEFSDAFGKAIVPNFKLADDFIDGMNRFRGRKSVYAKDWESTLAGIRELPVEERKILYRMLENKRFGLDQGEFDLEKLGIASESRAKIQEYGQALVNLGILEEKTFIKNIDDYLHTSYMKHEGKLPKANYDGDNLSSAHHMFMMRGKVERNFPKSLWEKGSRPKEKTPEEKEFFADKWEVISEDGDNLVIRRQWTKEEKLGMGEIEDAAYAMQKTGLMMGHERGLGEFFKELSESPQIIVGKGRGGFEVPDNGQWGALGGKNINLRTWEELKRLREYNPATTAGAKAWNAFSKYYKITNGVWKGFKTIAAPPVHFGNFVSSGHMFDMFDGNWADVGRAARDMYQQNDMYNQMLEDGIFGGSFVRELGEGQDDILNMYGQSGWGHMRLGDGPNHLAKGLDFTTRLLKKLKGSTWDNAAKLYQLEDNIWRAALYKTKYQEAIDGGMDVMKARNFAARQAKEVFVDYDQNTPLLKGLRHTILPFMSYTYGTIPRLAEVAAKDPIKYAKWAGIYAGLNMLGENLSGEDDYVIERAKTLMKDNPLFGVPFMPDARMMAPGFVKDFLAPDSRDLMSLNAERLGPGGTFTMSEGGLGQIPGVPTSMQPGGGVVGAAAWPLIAGIDQFSGRELDGWDKRGEAAVRNLLPNWPGLNVLGVQSWAEQKRGRAEAGGYDKYKDVYSPATATLSEMGIRLEPISTRKLTRRIKKKYETWNKEGKIDKAKSEIFRIKNEGSYTKEEKSKRIAIQKRKIKKLKAERRRELYGE